MEVSSARQFLSNHEQGDAIKFGFARVRERWTSALPQDVPMHSSGELFASTVREAGAPSDGSDWLTAPRRRRIGHRQALRHPDKSHTHVPSLMSRPPHSPSGAPSVLGRALWQLPPDRTRRLLRTSLTVALLILYGCDRQSTGSSNVTVSTPETASQDGPYQRVLPATPSCLDCALEHQLRLTMAVEAEGVLLPGLPWVQIDSRGRFVVAAKGGHAFFVFDASGRLERAIGARGGGPGEFESLGPLAVSAGDTIFATASARQINVYAPSGAFVRQTILQHTNVSCLPYTSNEFVPLADGRLLIGSSVRKSVGSDHPITLVDISGRRLSGFGVENTSTVGSLSCRALVVNAETGSLWASEPFGYRLEELRPSADGSYRTVRQIGVQSPWFRDGGVPLMTPEQLDADLAKTKIVIEQPARPTRMVRPPWAALRNFRIDATDRLWLAWSIPAPQWDTVRLQYKHSDEMMLSDDVDDQLWHTVIDVIDTRSQELLVRDTFPFRGHLAAPGELVHPRYSSTGGIEVDVYRLHVKRK